MWAHTYLPLLMFPRKEMKEESVHLLSVSLLTTRNTLCGLSDGW